MRVAIYARVSTKEQTTANQLRDLKQTCKARKWQIVKEFVDAAVSGAKQDRPALRELMLFARQRKCDVVLVWRFDRFARSLKQLITTLEEFKELGIHFFSFSEAIDTTTSQGRLVFGVIGSIAEFERDLIRERVNSGLRRAKEEGIRLGRPRREVDLAKALQLRNEGLSLREIAKQLKESPTTLHRLFQKPSKELLNASDGGRD